MTGSWSFTWQDPVAIALVALALLVAWWLRRRLGRGSKCEECPAKKDHV